MSKLLNIDGFDYDDDSVTGGAHDDYEGDQRAAPMCSVCGGTGVVYVGELEDMRYRCKSCAPEVAHPLEAEQRSFMEHARDIDRLIRDPEQGGRSDLAQLVELKRWKAWIDSTAKEVNGAIESLEESLLAQFAEEGVSSKRTADGALVSISKKVWASAKDQEALNRALIAGGFGWLVKRSVNSMSLSGWVRELGEDANGDPKLPAAVAPLLNVTTKRTLSVRGK
jgi:hypothetical protein